MFISGSLTLHHWQQLAKPHLATILDPHPGVVTKGFRPLAQDTVYHLSDMEEDEEDDERRGVGVEEKGAAERSKEDEDEEEEEGGITFKVRYASTPEERKDRKHSVTPLPVPPVRSSPLSTSPGTPAASSSVRSDPSLTSAPLHLTETSSLSSLSIPGAAAVHQICTSTSTTASSSGNVFANGNIIIVVVTVKELDLICLHCVQSKIQ